MKELTQLKAEIDVNHSIPVGNVLGERRSGNKLGITGVATLQEALTRGYAIRTLADASAGLLCLHTDSRVAGGIELFASPLNRS